jgi:hypothetical protein
MGDGVIAARGLADAGLAAAAPPLVGTLNWPIEDRSVAPFAIPPPAPSKHAKEKSAKKRGEPLRDSGRKSIWFGCSIRMKL